MDRCNRRLNSANDELVGFFACFCVETRCRNLRGTNIHTDTSLCHKLCYLLLLPLSHISPPIAALIWGHISALGPIRWLDASLPEMLWAQARSEVLVKGATGWLVTRGFKQREGVSTETYNK